MNTLLEIKNLATYFYTDAGVVKAVDGISFNVERGETLALVGESGCGKSVTALSILRLIPDPPGKITNGEIIYGDTDLLLLRDNEMRAIRGKEISIIFQEPMTSLNPVLTIERQLTEGMMLHLRMTKKTARVRAIELLKTVGMPDPENRLKQYPHQFSGGMRQRVMIAMALSCNPRIIIADEPTTALDVTTQAQILDMVKDLTQQMGISLILITHNLGIVARYADRINIMYSGKIVEQGVASELYKDPRHPYTVGLLKSVPRLDQPKTEKLSPIKGQPPDLINLPHGCYFEPRCPNAIEDCSANFPPFLTINQGHKSACWIAGHLNDNIEG